MRRWEDPFLVALLGRLCQSPRCTARDPARLLSSRARTLLQQPPPSLAARPGGVSAAQAARNGGLRFQTQAVAALHSKPSHSPPSGSSSPTPPPSPSQPKLAFLPGSSLSFPHGLSPSQGYDHLVASGKIDADPQQVAVLRELSELHSRLAEEAAPPPNPRAAPAGNGLWYSLFGGPVAGKPRSPARPATSPGLYLWGGTGCGKTFLMDIFYTALPSPAKRRVHFHAFMLDVHARLHAIRSAGHRGDPIPVLAAEMMQGVRIMCFDEMQVTDVGDAMIMRRLFDELFARQLVVVATSNRAPIDLYASGLQRELFMPFIHALGERCKVVRLHSPVDYRLLLAAGRRGAPPPTSSDAGGALAAFPPGTMWFCPAAATAARQRAPIADLEHPASPPLPPSSNSDSSSIGSIPPAVSAAFEASWQRLAATGPPSQPAAAERTVALEAQGRRMQVRRTLGLPRTGGAVNAHQGAAISAARFTFAELCEAPLYAGDYAAIAAAFSHVFIEGIPSLTLSERNELRRFITLIDVLYEAKVQLVASASEQPWVMLRAEFREEGTGGGGGGWGPATAGGGPGGLAAAAAPAAGGARLTHAADERTRAKYDEVFAFDRTVSRLIEMGSEEYRVKSKWGAL